MHTYNFTCNVLDLICDEKPFLNASAIWFWKGWAQIMFITTEMILILNTIQWAEYRNTLKHLMHPSA